MTFNGKLFLSVLTYIILLTISCSQSQNDYECIIEYEKSQERLLQDSYDYNIRIQACQSVIDSVKSFIDKYEEGDLVDEASSALNLWNKRKSELARASQLLGLKEIQESTEILLKSTFDYEGKIDYCLDVINSIQTYIKKFGENPTYINKTLLSWQQRRSEYIISFNLLKKRIYDRNKNKAVKASQNQHLWSDIVKFELKERNEKKTGKRYIVEDIYFVRMKGRIIGTNIFKLDVTISGYADMETGLVGGIGKAQVVE